MSRQLSEHDRLEALIAELSARMEGWGAEYQQPRDLGARGEFVGLYRKARKLKTVLWDGVDASKWREPVRIIALEIAAHALLLVADLDKEQGACTADCSETHTYTGPCLLAAVDR